MQALGDVLNNLKDGYYLVPEIQRGFVWRNPQIRDFIVSIYNEEPVGSIIYWDPPLSILNDESFKDMFKPLADDLRKENGKYLIIDGQQRLTSLLLVKMGELSINGKKRKIELYFNPIEEKFELGSKEVKEKAEWFNVTEILKTDDVNALIEEHVERGSALVGNPLVRKGLQHLREVFATYNLPFVGVKFNPSEEFLQILERMARIFINLNSTGTRVKMPDLALALLTAKTRNEIGQSFREDFMQLLKECENLGFALDESVLIRTYSAIATGTTKFRDAKGKLDKMGGRTISEFLKETRSSIKETIASLENLGIRSERFLQSRYLVVPIAYLLHCEVLSTGRITSDDLKMGIAKWLILSSFEKRYTGKLETELSSDIQKIYERKGLDGLYENLNFKEIAFSKLKGDYENYHLTMLLLLYTKIGTLDWNEKEIPRPKKIYEIHPKQLTIHHIFPEEYLERRGIHQEYDTFGNITILSDDANKNIKFKDPASYLNKLEEIDSELLEKHCIPRNKELWNVNRYEDFIMERLNLIASKIESEFKIRVLKS